MLRCTFGGTFTPPVKVVHGQVTTNPPTNNPDATAVLELELTHLHQGSHARETKTDLGRHAHARAHTQLAGTLLMAEF